MKEMYILLPLGAMLAYCGLKLLDIGLLDIASSLSNPKRIEFWDTVVQVTYGVIFILTGGSVMILAINILPLW